MVSNIYAPCFLNSVDTINLLNLSLLSSLGDVKDLILNAAINYKASDFREV